MELYWIHEIIQAINIGFSFVFMNFVLYFLITSPELRNKKNYTLLGLFSAGFGYCTSRLLIGTYLFHPEVEEAFFILAIILAAISVISAIVSLFLFVVFETQNDKINLLMKFVTLALVMTGLVSTFKYVIDYQENRVNLQNLLNETLVAFSLFVAILVLFTLVVFSSKRLRDIFFPAKGRYLIGHNQLPFFGLAIITIVVGEGLAIIFFIIGFPVLVILGSLITALGLCIEFFIVAQTRRHLSEVAWQIIKFQVDELKKVDRMKDQFIDITSHELRTPITVIKGYMDLLEDQEIPKKDYQEYIDAVKRNISRIERLIGKVYDLSKFKKDIFDFHFEFTDFERTIRVTVEDMRRFVEKNGLTITFIKESLGDSVPLLTFFDQDRIAQVIRNLIENAVKNTSKGKITVKLQEKEREFLIQVTDTGVGIDIDDLPNIFEAFRFNKHSKANAKSLGLGLFISKNIIEAHGGKIWAHSEGLGKGSIFGFTVPKREY